jgi:hypothetical protein
VLTGQRGEATRGILQDDAKLGGLR